MPAIPIKYWVAAAFVAMAAFSLWRFSDARYAAGYAERNAHYEAALKAKNDQIATLNAELAAVHAAEEIETAQAVAKALANRGDATCRVLSDDQRAALNAIK